MQPDTPLAEPGLQSVEDCPESVADDRRRPGRPDHVSPTLVPLLRGDLPTDLPLGGETELADDRGDLAPAVGVVVALGASVPLWAAIGLAAWAALR